MYAFVCVCVLKAVPTGSLAAVFHVLTTLNVLFLLLLTFLASVLIFANKQLTTTEVWPLLNEDYLISLTKCWRTSLGILFSNVAAVEAPAYVEFIS